ncbi:hypothetical protein IFM89_028303 [Coptis chinensis]|uniref:Uncharacterized protein n=1 Tax=Coptis chinensis TaxID=261450 RepID=A0A835HFW8_9MAGN|nr:hypothetical protein IFM89_028303 [Coptis chinensis]
MGSPEASLVHPWLFLKFKDLLSSSCFESWFSIGLVLSAGFFASPMPKLLTFGSRVYVGSMYSSQLVVSALFNMEDGAVRVDGINYAFFYSVVSSKNLSSHDKAHKF